MVTRGLSAPGVEGESPGRGGPWLVIAAAVLSLLAFNFVLAFLGPTVMSNPGSGTPWAPHSDALGPWLDGGLAYLFGLQPPTYLYRPTVALFWASLLAATGHVQAISLFFTAWLLVLFTAAIALNHDRPMRNALVLALAVCTIRFPETWSTVNLNVDLAALAITVSGITLLVWDRGTGSRAALLAGSACLGVAAAIRGPMMLGGILMIAVRVLLMERTSKRLILAAGFLFLLPLVGDASLQKHLGTINNGMMALYCVYTDPTHGWTGACNIDFLAKKPTSLEILQGFLSYLLSAEGRTRLFDLVRWRIARDLALLHMPATLALIVAFGTLATHDGSRSAPFGVPRSLSPVIKAGAVAASLGIVHLLQPSHEWVAFAWIACAFAIAALSLQWRAFLCLIGYLSATLYLCMASLLEDRLQNTFAFALTLGVAFLVMDAYPRASLKQVAGRFSSQRPLSVAVLCVIAFLYVGSFVVRSDERETYLRAVYRVPGTAMKIADDPRIDRSLYYSWQRQLIYTKHDDLAIGAVRKYRSLVTGASANASFIDPNSFTDQ